MKLEAKFDRVFLHIGLGKTGTTSVQEDLLEKADLLEKRYGLHYPRGFSHAKGYEGNHSILLRALFSDHPDVKRQLARIGLISDRDLDRFNQKTVSQLKRGFESTSAPNLLLSAESVGRFRVDQLPKLADWLSGMADSIFVIACVRHPMHALSSEIQQRLYIGNVLESLYEKPPVYKLRPLFERFNRTFGKESLKTYSFADATQDERGLTAVFLRQLGIDADADFPKTKPRNTSISLEGALLLSSCNELRPRVIDGERNPERFGVNMDYFRELPGKRFCAPLSVYSRIEESVERDVQWFEETYSLKLGTYVPPSEQQYSGFSQESIDFIASELADRSRHRYAPIASLVGLLSRPYLYLRKTFRRFTGR